MSLIRTAIVATAAVAIQASAEAQNFGTLTQANGTEIDFTVGSGIGNSNFVFNNFTYGAAQQDLTVGLQCSPYYSAAANGTPVYAGNGEFIVNAGLNQSGLGFPEAPRWGFQWSVTLDGAMIDASEGLAMSMTISGPSGNWGSHALPLPVFGNVEQAGVWTYQGSWNVSYDFLQAASNDPIYGGLPAGLWDGLGFDADELGTYEIDLVIWDSSASAIGSASMSVTVVPAPGALALLGVAGLSRRRRR